jgi:DNA-binding MarR family transcriptional regulator
VQETAPETARPISAEQLADELLGFVSFVLKYARPSILDVAATHELSLSQLRALYVLDAADRDLALHELASRVGLSVAATGRAVDVLVRERVATRTEDAADRRVKRIAITDAGRATVMRMLAARREALRALAAGMDDDERLALSRALAPLLARPDVDAVRRGVCR